MELEDLYDINFNKINKVIRRRLDDIPKDCYVMMSYAFIKNGDKYLLETADERSNNTIAIPGGHVLAGEDGITGLKRELKEELGLENLNIKHIDTVLYPKNSYIFNMYLIEDEIDTTNLKSNNQEIVSIDWYTKEEIEELLKQGRVNKGYAFMLKKFLNI